MAPGGSGRVKHLERYRVELETGQSRRESLVFILFEFCTPVKMWEEQSFYFSPFSHIPAVPSLNPWCKLTQRLFVENCEEGQMMQLPFVYFLLL